MLALPVEEDEANSSIPFNEDNSCSNLLIISRSTSAGAAPGQLTLTW